MPRAILRQIPNALSISRIVLAFAFPFLPLPFRLVAIVWALLSEFFDGFLARRLHAESALGQALDPIADKLFVLSVMGTLIHEHRLGWIHFVLIAMRDIIVAVGTLSVVKESGERALLHLKPRFLGKVATAFQFFLLVSLFVFDDVVWPLFAITVTLSCVSGVDYLYSVLHRRFDNLPLTARSGDGSEV